MCAPRRDRSRTAFLATFRAEGGWKPERDGDRRRKYSEEETETNEGKGTADILRPAHRPLPERRVRLAVHTRASSAVR